MKYIKIKDRELEASLRTRYADPAWDGRACKVITCALTAAEAVALFESGTPWSYVGADGTETDLSAYALAGPVTDNRDGTVTVKMGAYRAEELMAVPLGEAPADYAAALSMRAALETLAYGVEDDATAVTLKFLYPTWESLVAAGYTAPEAGYRFRYKLALYKTAQAGLTFAAHYLPGEGTEALFTCIDDTHAGTADDPIPYGGNLELLAGLYYREDGALYLCTRSTGAAVHQSLSELAGIYVEAVEVAA